MTTKLEISVEKWGDGTWLIYLDLPGKTKSIQYAAYETQARAMTAARKLRTIFINPPEIEVID